MGVHGNEQKSEVLETVAGKKQLHEAEEDFNRLIKGVRAVLRYA